MWLQGKIKGHQVKIEETIEQWLQNLYSNKPKFANSFCSRFYNLREIEKEDSDDILSKQKEVIEDVIPIVISVNHLGKPENLRIMWNYNEETISPEALAKILTEDNGYPQSIEQEICGAIKRAIENHKPFDLEFDPNYDENIFTIELDIQEMQVSYTDTFEWDIYEPLNSPYMFAKITVEDLGLPQIFENLIAHEIYRQIYNYKRFLCQNTENLGSETFTRQKKIRGFKDPNFGRFPVLMRKNPVTPDTLFRNLDEVGNWEPNIVFTDN